MTKISLAPTSNDNDNDDKIFRKLYDMSFSQSKERMSDFFPLSYTASALFRDGSIETATQVVALEYGCSLDAVGMLANAILQKMRDGTELEAIVQVDSLGAVHAPFAVGRSFLSENTDGKTLIYYSQFSGNDPRELVLKSVSKKSSCFQLINVFICIWEQN